MTRADELKIAELKSTIAELKSTIRFHAEQVNSLSDMRDQQAHKSHADMYPLGRNVASEAYERTYSHWQKRVDDELTTCKQLRADVHCLEEELYAIDPVFRRECHEEEYIRLIALRRSAKTLADYKSLEKSFRAMNGFEDTIQLSEECAAKIASIRAQAKQEQERQREQRLEKERMEKERQAELEREDREYLEESKQVLPFIREPIAKYQCCISIGPYHAVALNANGTVIAIGVNHNNQCNTSHWRDIVAISAGTYHSVGLKANGTVVHVGDERFDLCDVCDWRDIVAISAGGIHTVGLKDDGTVVTVGLNHDGECNTSDWRDIVAISTSDNITAGLKVDGTVVTVGSNRNGGCNTSDWHDIVAISVGNGYTLGLKIDGTVIVAGLRHDILSAWRDIIAVSAGWVYPLGLKADGTVITTGHDFDNQWDIFDWKNIVAIFSNRYRILGLKENGSVVESGGYEDQLRVASEWKGIEPYCEAKANGLRDFEQEQEKKRIKQLELRKSWEQQGMCRHCGGILTLFRKKCNTCGHSN